MTYSLFSGKIIGMDLSQLIGDGIGWLHVIFGVIALLFGTTILIRRKGDQLHRKFGYVYTLAMLGLNITALLIYRLFGSFGIFHWLALISLLTLIAGLLPVFLKKPKRYLGLHLNFMYWSVIGLYGALVAETMVRIPDVVIENDLPTQVFYRYSGLGAGLVMFVGIFFILLRQKKWDRIAKAHEKSASAR